MEGVLPLLSKHGRMFQLKTTPSRLTGVSGTICHYVTVPFAGGGNQKQEMRSVGSLLYLLISKNFILHELHTIESAGNQSVN